MSKMFLFGVWFIFFNASVLSFEGQKRKVLTYFINSNITICIMFKKSLTHKVFSVHFSYNKKAFLYASLIHQKLILCIVRGSIQIIFSLWIITGLTPICWVVLLPTCKPVLYMYGSIYGLSFISIFPSCTNITVS